MTYLQLAVVFLLIAAVGGFALSLTARRSGPSPLAIVITVLVLFILTAVFDTAMIASGLFHYAEDPLLGLHIGLAPIEDFAYPLAGAVLLPALWTALRAARQRRTTHRASDREVHG